MKTASIVLHLSKDHSVQKHDVTPIEAMLLIAEHNSNAGKNPVEVMPGTEKEIKMVRREKKMVKTSEKKEGDKTVDVMEERELEINGTRSINDEIFRLRSIYQKKKVDAIIKSGLTMPETFEEAAKLGLQISMPTERMVEKPL